MRYNVAVFLVSGLWACGGSSSDVAGADGGGSGGDGISGRGDVAATGGDDGGGDAADAGGSSGVLPVQTGGGPTTDATVAGQCDPVQPYESGDGQIACPKSQTCAFDIFSGTTVTSCTGPVGLGLQGDSCTALVDCAAGYDCTVVKTVGRCSRYCRYGDGFEDCGSTYTCTAFVDPEYEGAQQIGVCL
jgi:hypothetical protein